ncbi:MAG TPA: hypothetical protein PKM56_18340 [Candidatus Rifleibacterium sp.]|nr:hypothetical protein [Candidatus Rifleibacterium sp.]
MDETTINADGGVELQRLRNSSEKPARRSCFSWLFGLFCSTGFILAGLVVALALFLLKAPRDEALIGAGFFLFAFIMQRRASRQGCIMPFVIFFVFVLCESGLIGVLVYQTGAYKNIDPVKIRTTIEREAPEAYIIAQKLLTTSQEQASRLLDTAADAIKTAFNGSNAGSEDQNLAALEAAFKENPGDPASVLAYANACFAREDLFSVRMAISLYEALAETETSDFCLERLAHGYLRIFRADLAFATAARRLRLPYANPALVARQIAFIAVESGSLGRGILELENLLKTDPVDIEEVQLLLAALYNDVGEKDLSLRLLDRLIAETPEGMPVVAQAAALRKQVKEN